MRQFRVSLVWGAAGLLVAAAVWLGDAGVTASAAGAPAPMVSSAAMAAQAAMAAAATASPPANGTEYVTFWSGDLRIFAHRPNTEVTLIKVADAALLPINHHDIDSTNVTSNPFILANAGDSFEGDGGRGDIERELRIRIEASEPVTVWTGSLSDLTRHPDEPPDDTAWDSWGSYIPAFGGTAPENGREIGFEFLGFTTRELRIIALRDPSNPTSVVVEDLVTNTDGDSDDNYSLTPADASYADAEIEVFELDGFEDDTVRITSNVKISVLAGLGLSRAPDWTATPPSYADGEDGSELGTLFYAFAHRSLTVFPTEDDTNVTITDLTDGDDSKTIFLANGDPIGDYDLYTPTLETRFGKGIVPRPADPVVTILDNGGDPFDDDLVKVESDKPILVYIGPVGSDIEEFADVAYSIETGPDSRILYCYAQNHGGSNDLQVFGFDPETVVKITSLSYTREFRATGQHDFEIGPGMGGGGTRWKQGTGDPLCDVWWGAKLWNGEMLRIESTKPVTVFNGDYDHPHFGAFVPFVLANVTLPPVAVATVVPEEVCPGEAVTLDGSASYDQDTVAGGQTPRHEWDFDLAVDSSGDGIPDNDIDATGAIVVTTYSAIGPHTAQLTYFDDEGEFATATVVITVTDQGCVCPHSQGFWKTHPGDWPVLDLILGAEIYDQGECLALLRRAVRGDASLILAKQLIAAKLNIEAGSDPLPAIGAITSADAILSTYPGKMPYGVHPSTPEGHEMTTQAGILDDYNNKVFTPGCTPPPVRPSGKDRDGGWGAHAFGGCAPAIGGSMTLPGIAGFLVPYLALAFALVALRLFGRKRARALTT